MVSYWNVYLVTSVGLPRDHHAIFIETDAALSSGHTFQVTGNIQNGMTYENKPTQRPEEDATYYGKALIGKVSVANFPRVREICAAIPAPKKQFEGPRRLYPQEPPRRCQEWTREAVDALVVAGVLES